MKKYASVPFLCKVKRLIRNISNAGIRIKKNTEISFCRNKDVDADKTYTLGNEIFISLKTICTFALVIAGAVLAALLTAKICFEVAVAKKSRR